MFLANINLFLTTSFPMQILYIRNQEDVSKVLWSEADTSDILYTELCNQC